MEKELKKSKKYIDNIKESLLNYYRSAGLFIDDIQIIESKNEYNFFIKGLYNNNVIISSPRLNTFESVVKYIEIIVNNFSKLYQDQIDKKII